jgi:8-oxo-dGTP pyrophosphatase MutT (NUDIX family)
MTQPTTPHLASTVVLVRPDPRGNFQILMNRRPEKMDTYAGVYVFPGGRVEKSDWSAAIMRLVRGLSPSAAQEKLGTELQPEICLGHWVAAVRELFEEVGIHFFVPQVGAVANSRGQAISKRLSEKRAALQQCGMDFATFLESEQLCCDVAPLAYFYHRITPDHYPVRFDTRFYLAALPPDQTPLHASEEVSESLWISPKEALDRSQRGNFPMMPPTLAVLRAVSSHRSWDELRDVFNLSLPGTAESNDKGRQF